MLLSTRAVRGPDGGAAGGADLAERLGQVAALGSYLSIGGAAGVVLALLFPQRR